MINAPSGCLHYLNLLLDDPINIFVFIISLCVALSLLAISRFGNLTLRQKTLVIYGHVIALIFPFVYVLFSEACQKEILQCKTLQTYAIGIPGIMIGILIMVIGASYIAIPLMVRSKRSHSKANELDASRMVRAQAKNEGWRIPDVYLIDSARPHAFSFSQLRPSIFISIGMFDILSKKEIEAVMLHELWHTHSHSAHYKLTAALSRFLSPLAAFSDAKGNLSQEERDADAFAVRLQGTRRHLSSAKEKIDAF